MGLPARRCAVCLMCSCSSDWGAASQALCCVFYVFMFFRPGGYQPGVVCFMCSCSSDQGATSQALCCVFDVFMFFRLGGYQPGVVLRV